MQRDIVFELELNVYLQKYYTFYAEDKTFFKKLYLYALADEALKNDIKNGQEHIREDPLIFGSPNADLSLDIEDFHREHSIGRALTRIIAEKNLDPIIIYKKARIDRKLFSKIRTHDAYVPSKKTMIAFALSLELSLKETQDFLALGGYTLSKDILFDVIVSFFLEKKIYDLDKINTCLFEHSQNIF